MPNLSDVEVMEYVSGDVLMVPVICAGEESRPMPFIEVTLDSDWITISLIYRDAEALKHLENILHKSQLSDLEKLETFLRRLPASFETSLMKREFKEDGGFNFTRKYIASRVDGSLLRLLINESKVIRSGGRRNVDGQSVYSAPATPVLKLVHIRCRLDEGEFKALLAWLKPVVEVVSSIKTRREMIHSRISKPLEQANDYRGFVTLLNKARGQNHVSAEERRSLEKRWREVVEERDAIEEELKRRLGETT